jgi:hypothetical protein
MNREEQTTESIIINAWAKFPEYLKETFKQISESLNIDLDEDGTGFPYFSSISEKCILSGTTEVDTGLQSSEIALIQKNGRISPSEKENMLKAFPFLQTELNPLFQGIAELSFSCVPKKIEDETQYHVCIKFNHP